MLLDVGIPSAVVVPPRDIAANPQLRHRGLFEVEEHAVTGAHEIPTLPFRFSRVGRWLRLPAPTLGREQRRGPRGPRLLPRKDRGLAAIRPDRRAPDRSVTPRAEVVLRDRESSVRVQAEAATSAAHR